MSWDPQKFFIGLVDFFSVWLPGAVLVYLAKLEFGFPIAGTEEWLVFLFASYLVGQFVFLLGAYGDEWVYDPLRKGTDAEQIRRLAEGKRLSPSFVRKVGRWLFRKDDKPLRRVLSIKGGELGPTEPAINAFQWCKAKLALEHPGALAEVQRFEADSKFFRSLCVILVLVFAWQVLQLVSSIVASDNALGPNGALQSFLLAAAALVVLLFALWRYAERRSKSVCQAYWLTLTAAHAKPSPAPIANRSPAPTASATSQELTHAGGIVLRRGLATASNICGWRRKTRLAAGSFRRAISNLASLRPRPRCARYGRKAVRGQGCTTRLAT